MVADRIVPNRGGPLIRIFKDQLHTLHSFSRTYLSFPSSPSAFFSFNHVPDILATLPRNRRNRRDGSVRQRALGLKKRSGTVHLMAKLNPKMDDPRVWRWLFCDLREGKSVDVVERERGR